MNNLSKNPTDWAWKNVHVAVYTNLPWTKIPLMKYIFDREVPAAGNT